MRKRARQNREKKMTGKGKKRTKEDKAQDFFYFFFLVARIAEDE